MEELGINLIKCVQNVHSENIKHQEKKSKT